MAEAGKCATGDDKCLEGTYCPATDETIVDCKPCDNSITIAQGCNCVADTPTENCMTCTADKCTACIKGFIVNTDDDSCDPCIDNCSDCSALDVCTTCSAGFFKTATDTCEACSTDCSACSDADTCTACNPGTFLKDKQCTYCADENCDVCSDETTCTACQENFVLQDKQCVPMCDDTAPCADETNFCDSKTKTCKPCAEGCTKCKSETICGKCDAGKVPNVNGVCEDICIIPTKAEEYCNNGTAVACAAGITSQCKCGMAKNCAVCGVDKTKCGSCLKGFKMEADACDECADGYEKFETLCVMLSGSGKSSKLSTGAIAGIVVAALVVVGGVGGGLAYYFIKKNKK